MSAPVTPEVAPTPVAPFIRAAATTARAGFAGRTVVGIAPGQIVAFQVKSGGIRFGEATSQAFNANGVSQVRLLIVDVRAISQAATEWPAELPRVPVLDSTGTQKTRTVKAKGVVTVVKVWETATLPSSHICAVTLPTVTPSTRKSKQIDNISI